MPSIDRQRWWRNALCRKRPSNVPKSKWVAVFFPEEGVSRERAKGMCARCPVVAPCIEAAVMGREDNGVWGGSSERQRRRWRRAMTAGRMDEVQEEVARHIADLRRVHGDGTVAGPDELATDDDPLADVDVEHMTLREVAVEVLRHAPAEALERVG